MIPAIETEAQLAEGLAALIAAEPRFAQVFAASGPPPLRRTEPGLAGLLRLVTDQLISRAAADAIWRRLEAALCPLGSQAILEREVADLAALGLTGAKARSFHAIARALHEDAAIFETLAQQSDEEIFARLTGLPGIGPWTAENYLLSCLGRADAFPAGDLALQIAAQDLFALETRPRERPLRLLAKPWRPWRAVAARLLWSHYRRIKGLPSNLL